MKTMLLGYQGGLGSSMGGPGGPAGGPKAALSQLALAPLGQTWPRWQARPGLGLDLAWAWPGLAWGHSIGA